MIAMFIMIILLSIALPTYNRSVQHARETVLSENLWQMRRAIDQYRADKGRLPGSLEDLVSNDPITQKTEWDEIMGEDPMSADAEQGLVDVKSLSDGKDTEGKEYKEY